MIKKKDYDSQKIATEKKIIQAKQIRSNKEQSNCYLERKFKVLIKKQK